ncbi:MAG: aminodeoxychorismate synthase component I [Hyphomicrobiaceae bacterium]|nr:aminodeoxychorismate synthase component I [Hyphomicrobiaceae bacterium]
MKTADKKPLPAGKPPGDDDTPISETFVLLDDSSGKGGRSLFFREPLEIISAHAPDEVEEAIRRVEVALADGHHVAGFLAYELGYVLEPKLASLMPESRKVPLIWLGVYGAPDVMTSAEVAGWLDAHALTHSYQFTDVSLAWNRDAYVSRFERVQEKIRAGDIYQLNLTFKARFKLTGSPLAFYRDVRQRQRVAYAAIVDTGEATVLSASPELFIEQHDRVIETRPMKGTAPRAGRQDADETQRRILATDTKQRAENLMIVDLMRNDLGRIAEIGSVSVTDLFTVETFRTLHQMTSGVRATLKEDVGFADLLRAIFPPGSVTGAPKIRAMELIREYESEPRGVYCGAIGYIAPASPEAPRTALFNVAIRTPVVFRDSSGEMGIGSGVVYDSEGAKEYAECLLKLKFLTDPPKSFELIETLLFDGAAGYVLLDRHMARLAASANYFGFPFDSRAIETALANVVEGRAGERLRVRLLLAEDGRITVTAVPQPAQAPGSVMRYVVSPTRLNSSDALLYHKTTRRELYDREWQQFHDNAGADEVVYLNENGDLAEGSRTNIFVERGGVLLTPPLSAGLLPGTLRADLIASGRAREAVLRIEDLAAGSKVFLGNSVRGLLPAERIDGA